MATAFFDVAEQPPPSQVLATAAFAVEERPESTILVLLNGELGPARVTVKFAGERIDPEA